MEVRGTTLEGPNLIFYPIVHEYREGKVKRPLGCEKNMKPHAFPPRMHKHLMFLLPCTFCIMGPSLLLASKLNSEE